MGEFCPGQVVPLTTKGELVQPDGNDPPSKLNEVAVEELSKVPEKLTVWPGEAQIVLTLPGFTTKETDCAKDSDLTIRKNSGTKSHPKPGG